MYVRTEASVLQWLALLCCCALAQAGEDMPATTTQDAEALLQPVRERLVRDFRARSQQPAGYQEAVAAECRMFPEGQLYPHAFPALAFLNLALTQPEQAEAHTAAARPFIQQAITATERRLRVDPGGLATLSDYRDHATFLGMLNLVLAAYTLISEDTQYAALSRRLAALFRAALSDPTRSVLKSYPGGAWAFDTITVLLAISLQDRADAGTRSAPLVTQHLRWVQEHASDPELRLPYSRVNGRTGAMRERPRGCDLSLRLCFLPHLDADYAAQLYDAYARAHWIERGGVIGFAEWPHGETRFQDIDSGPVIDGVGLAATGMGIGAAIAADDRQRLTVLSRQLLMINLLRPVVAAQMKQQGQGAMMFPIEARYFTGFLFGDGMLFYCVTWCPWRDGIDKEKEER
jgi:hypothetical protein